VDLISARLSQAAPEASDKWKEQPATAIERWKAKNLATANKEAAAAAEKNNSLGRQETRSGGRFESELRRRSRSRSRERMRNKDLAMAGVGGSSAFGRGVGGGSTGVLPTPAFAGGQRASSKFDTPASFNPFDRSEAGGLGSGLLPYPGDGESISGSRFSAGSGGGLGGGGASFRAQNPFDNRGFTNSAADSLAHRPTAANPFDAFPSSSGGSIGGFNSGGGVTFGGAIGSGGMNPFDNRGGESGGGVGGNPFDRRRSRFDEPPAAVATSQIQRPGVWNEKDQVNWKESGKKILLSVTIEYFLFT